MSERDKRIEKEVQAQEVQAQEVQAQEVHGVESRQRCVLIRWFIVFHTDPGSTGGLRSAGAV